LIGSEPSSLVFIDDPRKAMLDRNEDDPSSKGVCTAVFRLFEE